MMGAKTHLELTIVRTQEKNFLVTLHQDGQPCGRHTGASDAYRAVHALVDGFRQWLKPGEAPQGAEKPSEPSAFPSAPPTDPSAPPAFRERGQRMLLHSVGVELFHLWMAPFWPDLKKTGVHPAPFLLTIIASPEILNLPWELLRWPDGTLLGLDPRMALRRRAHPPQGLSLPPGRPPSPEIIRAPGPLKMIWMASNPTGLAHTHETDDVERFCREIDTNPAPVTCHRVYPATAERLKQEIQRIQPHIVHLTGPALIRGEQGFFGFEDEEGQPTILSASEMARDIWGDDDVPLVILSGRESTHPPPVAAVAALCQTLTLHRVGLALAWPSMVSDPFFGAFFRAFLQNAAGGLTMDQAVQRAREIIQPDCERAGYPAWTLPMLYARSDGAFFAIKNTVTSHHAQE